jgi:hypothetical protein
MAKSPGQAYRNGYADGLRMAKKMRWQGTFLGALLKGACYRPEEAHRTEYDAGFKQAMEDTSAVEWLPPEEYEGC